MTSSHTQQPYRIGLTGGIASGKSTVAEMFRELGVAIIDTDIIARDVVQTGEPALNEIRERFGESVIDSTGQLDRGRTRKIIFANQQARLDLEAILHPRIGAEVRRQSDAATGDNHSHDYQMIVVPLLLDSPLRQFVDRVLVVDCDEETQLQRLLQRDSESVAQAKKILQAQSSREQRLAIADDVISNDGDLTTTRQRVIDLDRRYRRLADAKGPDAPVPETL